VDTTRKTLDETYVREFIVIDTWEKDKTTSHLLEQHLAVTQGVAMPHQEDDDHSDDASSNLNATLVSHLHTQAVEVQNIRSMVMIILEPLSPHYKRWCDLMLPTLRCFALDDHVLSDVVYMSTY
jgi:hypothetical protein